jgi:hypothetical protein
MKSLLFSIFIVALASQASAQMQCATPSIQVVDPNKLQAVIDSKDPAQMDKIVIDILHQYPSSDHLLLQRDLISSVCELVKNSPNDTFSEKAKLLIDLTKEIQSSFGKSSTYLKPIGNDLVLFTSVDAPDVAYYLTMASNVTIWTNCTVTDDKVEYADPVEFSRFVTYSGVHLNVMPPDVSASSDLPGNFILAIPKSLFFLSVDTGRGGIEYFRSLPSSNCYSDDIVMKLGVWTKSDNQYVGIFSLRSVTAHGQCRIFIQNETAKNFVLIAGKYRSFKENTGDDLKRDFLLASKADAFESIDKSKAIEPQPANPKALSVSFAMNKQYTPCMNRSIEQAINGS